MADTLANPRLDPVYADKERNAVNAEMESKGLRRPPFGDAVPVHPQSGPSGHAFHRRNLETLSDKPGSTLHDELIRFHRTWYSANLMKGVLYGPQSLDELEALARRELAVIADRKAQVRIPEAAPATEAERGVLVGVRPCARNARSLTIEFVLPQELDNPATKPLQVAASVLGAETGHSLVDTLRAKGWVLGLSAGGDTTSLRNGVTLSLFLQLTEEGYAQREAVLGTVFSYFDLLRRQGLGQAYFDQLRNMLAMQFRFAPLSSGFDYVAEAAETMLRHPVADVNFAGYRLDSFDRAAVDSILTALTPANARVFGGRPGSIHGPEAFFYQTPYSVRSIETTDMARWAGLALTDLRLPDLNPFVPDDFSVVPQAGSTPRRIVDTPGLTVWRAGSQFRHDPKAILMTRLQSASIASTLDEVAMQGVLLATLGPDPVRAQIPGPGSGPGRERVR